MMTQEEIDTIRMLLESEVNRAEQGLEDGLQVEGWTFHLKEANIALNAFNRESHLFRLGAAPHDVGEFYKEDDE